MAKFLTTSGVSNYIEQIVRNATKSIVIVCPYLRLNNILFDRLKDANKKGVILTLIYGKEKLEKTEERKLQEIDNLEIFYCKNLHAKCYHNDRIMVLSSMNLYEFSEKNNREMGILIELESDVTLFTEIVMEIQSIKDASIQEKFVKKNPEQFNILDTFKIDPFYNNIETFYIPLLLKKLKASFPNNSYRFSYNRSKNLIAIADFHLKEITLEFGSRLNFKFGKAYDYLKIKNENNKKLKDLLSDVTFYWNYKALSFPNPFRYPKHDLDYVMTEECAYQIADKYLDIIKMVIDKVDFYKLIS